MRKVSRECVTAFLSGKSKKIGNTESVNGELYLHGNRIAWINQNILWINNCGYETNTTKERLNAVLELVGMSHSKIYQRDFEWYWEDGRKFQYCKSVQVCEWRVHVDGEKYK